MKLKEKHLGATHSKIPWSGNAEQADNNYSKAAEASIKITKDYMKRFAEWKDENYDLFSDFPTFRYVDRFESAKKR